MKKLLKGIAKFLGKLVGKIEYRKFKPAKVEKGKLFNESLFEKVSDKYNIYVSKQSIKEQKLDEKQTDKEEISNLELAISRFLGKSVNSNNSDKYQEMLDKMYKNKLEDTVFQFIQNNTKLPIEQRFYMLNNFIDRIVNDNKVISKSELSKSNELNEEISLKQMVIKFLTDVSLKDENNKQKIKEIVILLSKIEKINDEKCINSLKDWFKECNNMISENKCDALIEEMKTVLDEVKKRKEKERIDSIIIKLNEQKENIKNNITKATSIEELENLATKINNLFEEGSKNNIIKANDCSELLKMISIKRKELSTEDEFVVEEFEDYDKNKKSTVTEVKAKKENNETQKQVKNVMKEIRTALINDGKELNIENCAKAASLFGANKELFDEETIRLFNNLIIKSFVKIEENRQKAEEAKMVEENAKIEAEKARVAEEKRRKLLRDKKAVLAAMRKASEVLTIVAYNNAKELFYNNMELFNKDEKDKCRITLSKIDYKINEKKQKELAM